MKRVMGRAGKADKAGKVDGEGERASKTDRANKAGRTGSVDEIERTDRANFRVSRKGFSLAGNVIYNMRSARNWDRRLFWYQLLLVFPDVGAAFLGVLLPAQLMRALEQKWEISALVICLLLFALGIWAMEMLRE